MGGKALGFEAIRVNKNTYYMLFDGISNAIHVNLIPSYTTKETFGNMSMLYTHEAITTEVIINCLEMLGLRVYENIVQNGDITSVGVYLSEKDVFQLDFIRVPLESLDFAYNYFSFNDMGNLLGRVARRVGLKFGYDGLWCVQRAPENDNIVLKEHLLTREFHEALEHLGYDVKRYFQGFDTLEDIFEYVMTSRFYDFDKFDLTQRNHKARIRDAKRPNYRAFLEYAQEHPVVNKIDSVEHYQTYHFGKFPNFYKEYFEVLEQHKLDLEVKKKYNGKVVIDVLQGALKGKPLGEFMKSIENTFTRDFILNSTKEDIEIRLSQEYLHWAITRELYFMLTTDKETK